MSLCPSYILCSNSHSAWKRQWQPTPVLLPGKSQGWRSLVGYSPWGRWVGHNWATSLSLFTLMHWRRKWKPTPVFLPGESQGRGAFWAAVYGVAQSRTWLKRLSSSSSTFCPVASFHWWSWTFFFFNLILFSPVCIYVFLGGSVVKNLPANAGHVALIPGLGRSPGGENSYLLQYSCLRNIMGRGTWQATVCGATESWAQLHNSAHTHHTLLTVCVYV